MMYRPTAIIGRKSNAESFFHDLYHSLSRQGDSRGESHVLDGWRILMIPMVSLHPASPHLYPLL
jgi:hypothetical protein